MRKRNCNFNPAQDHKYINMNTSALSIKEIEFRSILRIPLADGAISITEIHKTCLSSNIMDVSLSDRTLRLKTVLHTNKLRNSLVRCAIVFKSSKIGFKLASRA